VINDLRPNDPTSVGKYRLVARLGSGGMGQVYLARSPGGRQVAIKVIRPEYSEDAEFRVRFRREVAAARNVGGMYTADVVDAEPEGPEPWMATAYVPGPSLGEAVGDQGPLPEDSVLSLAAGLAEGLDAIHAAGLVHRDLKPSNVLLSGDGPRVIDFGISHAREGSSLTQTSAVMGTPGYMSPEQARGLAVGPASDVFSLGAVLTFAATGQGPFGTGPVHAMIYRVVHEQPDLSQLPDGLRPLIERCLAKAPEDRPTTATLLAELGPRVSELTGSWLPEPIVDSISRYVQPTPNSVAPPAPPASGAEIAEAVSDAAGQAPAADPSGPDAAAASAAQPPAVETPAVEALTTEAAQVPLAELVTAGVAGHGSDLAGPTAVVDLDGGLETSNLPAAGPVQVLTAAPGGRTPGSPSPSPAAGLLDPDVPPSGAEPSGVDGGGPPVRRRATPARRWPLAAAAGAALAIAAAVVLVLVLSPPATPKVIGDGTPSAISRPTPTVISVSAPQPTPSHSATKKPKPHASHTTAGATHSAAVATSAATQASQTSPDNIQTTAHAPTGGGVTHTPTHTPTESGPQTISSVSGASSDGCAAYGSVESKSGGAAASYTFRNDSSADIQVWFLTSSGAGDLESTVAPGNPYTASASVGQDWMVANSGGGCMGIYTISSSGEIVASS